MGFPMGYPDLLHPRLLLHFVFLLGFIRRLLFQLFTAVGLGDLLDSDELHAPITTTSPIPIQFRSPSAMLIQEVLPVVRYDDLVREGHVAGGECAVCLYEMDAGDEVRRLSNCRHVFHRCCLDRWIEHDQRTCPLCRASLLPEELTHEYELNVCVWEAAGIPDSYLEAVETEEFSGLESLGLPEMFLPQILMEQR